MVIEKTILFGGSEKSMDKIVELVRPHFGKEIVLMDTMPELTEEYMKEQNIERTEQDVINMIEIKIQEKERDILDAVIILNGFNKGDYAQAVFHIANRYMESITK